MKTNYLVTAQCEVLVEYANAVMAKYEKYLRSKSALDCVKKMYKDLCSYNTKIILCDNQSDLGALYSNIKEYEWIIEHIPSAVSVEALVWLILYLKQVRKSPDLAQYILESSKGFLMQNPVKNEFKTIPSIEKADKSKLKNYIPHTRKSITT